MILYLMACTDSGGDSASDEEPAEHACEHTDEAGAAVTAAQTLKNAEAVELHAGEEPTTVTLPTDGGGTFHGFVTLHGHGEPTLLFAGTANAVTGLYEDGTPSNLATPAPNEYCADAIPEHWDLDLSEGEWQLELGPSAVNTVWLMYIEGEGHAHDHE